MPDNTTTPVAVPPGQPTSAAPTTEKDVAEIKIQLGTYAQTFESYGRKKKGEDIQESVCIPKVNVDDPNALKPFEQLVGMPNWIAFINREVLRPVGYEASDAGFSDGKFNSIKYVAAFKACFDPRAAKSRGPSKADILEAQAKFAEELAGFVVKASEGKLQESDKNRFMQINLELARLGEALAKKNRKGKAPVTVAK